MRDIKDKTDVILFVNTFYERVQRDELLGPVFNGKIESERWPVHLEKMYRFWNTVLFGVPDYRGNPFSHHIHLDIHAAHFERWVSLFTAVIRESYEGEKAEEAILRAEKMRQMFEIKLANIRTNPNFKPLV